MAERQQTDLSAFETSLAALTATRGVRGAFVATGDGLPLAVRVRPEHDSEMLSAAAATLGRLAAKAVSYLDRGRLDVFVLDAERSRLLLRPLSFGYLVAIADPDANQVLISAEMGSLVDSLEKAVAAIASGSDGKGRT